MFKILCLTTGSDICWPDYWTKNHLTTKLVPKDVQDVMVERSRNLYPLNKAIIYFDTKEAAGWFIRRRLSYNEKRTDSSKLRFMSSLFDASELTGLYTKKHMFDIIEV